jgi:hypothetical protein
VTCDYTFANTESGRTWAIGGKRASLSNSTALFADAAGGYIIELEDGYSETLTTAITCSATGDTASGAITLRGASGSTTIPRVKSQAGNNAFLLNSTGDGWVFDNIQVDGSNQGVRGIFNQNASGAILVKDCIFNDWSFYGTSSCGIRSATDVVVTKCTFTDCYLGCFQTGTNSKIFDSVFENCVIAISTGGITDYPMRSHISNNIFSGGDKGISFNSANDTRDLAWGFTVDRNVFYGQTVSSFESNFTNSTKQSNPFLCHLVVKENVFAGGAGYAFSSTRSIDAAGFSISVIDRNAWYDAGYTSGRNNFTSINSTNDITLTANPFVDAANGDFNLNNAAGGGAVLRSTKYTLGG